MATICHITTAWEWARALKGWPWKYLSVPQCSDQPVCTRTALLAVVSGAMAGALFSLGERRTVFPYGMINMLFEWEAFAAGGPVFFGIKGFPPLDAVRNQRYL